MIAKILGSSSSFAGISYNERKTDVGTGELLSASNFGALELCDEVRKQDYINYMEKICSLNERVKNKQFHAVISCKGNEYSVDQLHIIAKDYISKMGYGQNPTLIYFHNDTENNHVHIVSTRVSPDGKKVNDQFEKKRSIEVLNQIMGRDLKEQAQQDFFNALDYTVSSKAQFKMILESSGWRIEEKDSQFHLYKAGRLQGSFNSEIDLSRKIDDNRAKQIAALLYKYKPGLNHVQLASVMKQKFGIDLVFHKGKGHDKPYGYTVIDHSGKTVIKGSSLVHLDQILAVPEQKTTLKAAVEQVQIMVSNNDKTSFEQAKDQLQVLGYKLDSNGLIKTTEGEIKLSDRLFETLCYNQRLEDCTRFNAKTNQEAFILSQFFSVKYKDVRVGEKPGKISKEYSEILKSMLNNKIDFEKLNERSIFIVENNGNSFLIDSKNNAIFSTRDIPELSKIPNSEKLNFEKVEQIKQSTNNSSAIKINIFQMLAGVIDQDFGSGDQPRKRKRNH